MSLSLSKKCYSRTPNAFSRAYLDQLQQEILASPYLDASHLSEGFVQTKGFSIVFKTTGISEIEAQFPYLQPYLQRALKPSCNAFYLNSLILEGGSYVEEHVDCSLSSYSGEVITPWLVSVLYVKVPTDLQGGQLVVKDQESQSYSITPIENTLVYFLGWLLHSVTSVQSSQTRISLICEQYNLTEEQLDKIPHFEIKISCG